MKKILLIIIFLAAFIFRLNGFNNPIADWHSWRQADTSAVSRNFIKGGFDILHPRFDDLSNVPSGFDNPKGFRFVEFPIYNVFQAGFFKIFGKLTLEQWGRIVSISSSLLSMLFLYLIVKKYSSSFSAILTAFYFGLLPYNIYFGRIILPDNLMVASILGGIYFFSKWIDGSSKFFFLLSLIFTASSFLLKPYALFFTLPIIYLVWKNFGLSFIKKWQIWIFLILSITPLILWRIWMTQFPEGIPVNAWLFNGGDIRFKGAFFQWIFADRIGRLILGYWGLPILILGIIVKVKNITWDKNFFISFIVSSFVYIFVIARGNVQHDYYQILIIPSLAIFLSFGTEFLLNSPKEYFSKTFNYLVFIVCFLFMFAFSWYFIRDFFNINNYSIVSTGQKVDKIVPKDAKVIALYNGDTSFLYQTNRSGWASFEKSLPEMIKLGAEYLVLVNPSTNDYKIGQTYKIVSSDSNYILFNLHKNP